MISLRTNHSIQYRFDFRREHIVLLRQPIRVAHVAHMDEQICLEDFLERRAKRGDELRRQVRDEADRVG